MKTSTMHLYQKMLCPKSYRKPVFTLPGHSLPSQYRTLLPVSDPDVARVLRAERTSRHIRRAVLALSAVLVLIVIVIVALIVAFQVSGDGDEELVLFSDAKHTITLEDIHPFQPSQSGSSTAIQTSPLPGTPCRDQCWEFSAFKFKAACVNNVCRCKDKFYDDVTCLPRYGDCHIKLYPPSDRLQFSHAGQLQNVYACRTDHGGPATTADQWSTEMSDSGSSTPETSQSLDLPGYYKLSLTDKTNPDSQNLDTAQTQDSTEHNAPSLTQPNLSHTDPSKIDVQKASLSSRAHNNVISDSQTLGRDSTEGGSHVMMSGKTNPDKHPDNIDFSEDETKSQSFSSTVSEAVTAESVSTATYDAPASMENIPTVGGGNIEVLEETSPRESSEEIHVISVRNNHGALATDVHITSDRNVSVVLCLVSYEPLTWTITAPWGLTVQSIYLISNHRVSRSKVSVSRKDDRDLESSEPNLPQSWSEMALSERSRGGTLQTPAPPVTRMLLKTGYGNDQMSGRTPQMLQELTRTLGNIHTFVGCAHADSVFYNIDF